MFKVLYNDISDSMFMMQLEEKTDTSKLLGTLFDNISQWIQEEKTKRTSGYENYCCLEKMHKTQPIKLLHIILTGTLAELDKAFGENAVPKPERLRYMVEGYRKIIERTFGMDSREFLGRWLTGESFITCKFPKMKVSSKRVHDQEDLIEALDNDVIASAYESYKKKKGLRESVRDSFATLGILENSSCSPYGLIIRTVMKSKAKIPDFVRFSNEKISFIYLIERDSTTEADIENLYRGYSLSYPEFYIWTGVELNMLLQSIATNPDKINWTIYEGSYRGKGNVVWDLLNNPEFKSYYAEHTAPETAKHFNIRLHLFHYIRRKYPEIEKLAPVYNSDVLTKDAIKDFERITGGTISIIHKEDPNYLNLRSYLDKSLDVYQRYREHFDEWGYQRNITENEEILSFTLGNITVIPDLVCVKKKLDVQLHCNC